MNNDVRSLFPDFHTTPVFGVAYLKRWCLQESKIGKEQFSSAAAGTDTAVERNECKIWDLEDLDLIPCSATILHYNSLVNYLGSN